MIYQRQEAKYGGTVYSMTQGQVRFRGCYSFVQLEAVFIISKKHGNFPTEAATDPNHHSIYVVIGLLLSGPKQFIEERYCSTAGGISFPQRHCNANSRLVFTARAKTTRSLCKSTNAYHSISPCRHYHHEHRHPSHLNRIYLFNNSSQSRFVAYNLEVR